eukprot:TRINITY_DN24691_c0_g1_i1.p1 TRINITY_DN24691_c0_g1~~TRINITY_DN24691_c0_g1_i1.p1  ORF type:complete len:230 (+),score=48.75 TRINITY_DN24691_c0_g1_i1:102-692(+)
MEELAIYFNERYEAKLEVRNSFLEFRSCGPKIVRSMSEPCMSIPLSHFNDSLASNSTSVIEDAPQVEKDLAEEGLEEGEEAATSVIVRDVPCKVDSERMMAELKHLGFDGCYNMIHFPTKSSKGKHSGKGYGFINFMNEALAASFMAQFENYRFDDISSQKSAHVEYARQKNLAGSNRRACNTRKFKLNPRGLKAQ